MAVKEYGFPVSVQSLGGGRTLAMPPTKPSLEVAIPPELGGPDARAWSPEDLLVAAVATCYAVTLAARATSQALSLDSLEVHGVGHVEKGREGSVFTVVELRVDVEADEASWPAVVEAARLAEEHCLVTRALRIPVHVQLELRAAGARRAA